jgi:hypothetical protein
MQPRVGELQNHRRRLARHERDMKIKMNELKKDFIKNVKHTEEGMNFYRSQLNALLELLPTQSSLAALQGLLGKGKTCTSEFVEKSTEYRETLHQLCEHCYELFSNRNKAFKEASILFEDGGEYAEKEVNACIASINDIMYAFEKQISEHKSEIESIRFKQDKCLENFSNFQIIYNEALIDLSMKEGLGKKFGGPRRHAQEKLRSEVNQSTCSEDEINHLIEILKDIGSIELSVSILI